MNLEHLKDNKILNVKTQKYFNNLFQVLPNSIQDLKSIIVPQKHLIDLTKYLQSKSILFNNLLPFQLKEIIINLIKEEFKLKIEYPDDLLTYIANEIICLLNAQQLSYKQSNDLKLKINDTVKTIFRKSSNWFNKTLDQLVSNLDSRIASQHSKSSSSNKMTRRDFLKASSIVGGVALTNPNELLKISSLTNTNIQSQNRSTLFQEAYLSNEKVSTVLLSEDNPVISIPAMESDSSLGSNSKLEKLKESIYFVTNKNLSVSPRLFNQNDILNSIPKLLSGGHFKSLMGVFNKSSIKKIHPLGPYGDIFIKIAKEYSLEIGLDYIALLSIVVSKSLNESHWNSESDVAKNSKQGFRGMGLFQQETNQVGIPGFPDPTELNTAEKQIRYEFNKILKAVKIVKAQGKTFKFDDIDIYYLGDSKSNPTSTYYLAYQLAKKNSLNLMRNMAAYKTEDLLNLFYIWQNGWDDVDETKYGLWPKKGNGGDIGQSLKNFKLIFSPFIDSKKVVKRVFPVDNKFLKKTQILNLKTRTLALYLKMKYSGVKLPTKILKKELLGFNGEEIYFALLELGYNVIAYNNYFSSVANILINSVEYFDLSLLVQPSELNKPLEVFDITKPILI